MPSTGTGGQDDNQCIVHLFGTDINTSSFALYTFSLAVMVQTLSLISMSAIADYGMNLGSSF
jgi:UMF1 family MFS transporter